MDKNKMLVDATHPEETRVVVLRNGRVEEFDYESASRKPLRGNIYLAKVTRVEPSLQAAFVDYGGNRHGFLAFNEIHPDYYQIPVADRQALLQQEAEDEARAEEEADAAAQARADRQHRRRSHHHGSPGLEAQPYVEEPEEETPRAEAPADEEPRSLPAAVEDAESIRREDVEAEPQAASEPDIIEAETANGSDGEDAEGSTLTEVNEVEVVTEVGGSEGAEAEQVEQVGNEDVMEEVPERPRRRMRSYKIQEVIKRRQIILVQVVKEERGNKGAALTTYLSLAGRYTVLMPNTGRGGGISRKITNAQDRKRLKAIAAELDVPEGMGLIIRTAGAARTKQEIKRDYEYLLRLWESVRDMTLQSTAPCLVYEEGNLIKRSIRDLYSKDIDEIIVAGDGAHREAHDFIRMLQPGGAKNVTHYQDAEPLFARYQIERQLNAMFSPYVTLRSGGYLVINQTEALVSIDVNSGKSTREFSIEETALNTNLEAADEIARQLKLRDLAGLIVIDFIDMEEKRNNRSVERRLKDALRHDRARIQVGRISHFGLLEMSRQRLRTGVLEGSTSQCPHCQGTGIIRSTESIALAVLRGIEDEFMKGRAPSTLTAYTTASVALYILNHKRPFITDMERRYQTVISVEASDRMQGANFTIERSSDTHETPKRIERGAVNMEWGFEDEGSEEREEAAHPRDEDSEEGGARRSRRRRRRGRGGDRGGEGEGRERFRHAHDGEREEREPEVAHDDAEADHEPQDEIEEAGGGRDARPRGERANGEERRGRRGRRRGRRGGRNREGSRHERGERPANGEHAAASDSDAAHDDASWHRTPGNGVHEAGPSGEGPAHETDHDSERAERAVEETAIAERTQPAEAPAHADPDSTEVSPARIETRREELSRADAVVETSFAPEKAGTAEVAGEPEKVEAEAVRPSVEPAGPPRKGWWQKRFGG